MIDKPINEAITDKQVLVLEENGTKLGILNTKEAIEKAKKEKKDLVLISKSENPKIISVAKIIEYKKFLYIQKKKEKENKNNFSVTKVKVVKITPHINDHDLH
jgi:translation initiation factor IF-3